MEGDGLIPLRNKEIPAAPSPAPALPKGQVIPKFVLPPLPTSPVPPRSPLLGVPSPAQQSWGVVISIIIIVLMIITGAFYAWGKRIAQERALLAPVTAP